MKKFWKMIASAAIAASMVSMTVVSVSAADYGNPPSYSEPEKVPETPADPETPAPGSTAEEPVKVVTDDTVKEALKADEPVIYVEAEKASVKEDAIGEIAKSDKPVTFVSEECSVTIDPALITEVKAINLAMEISVTNQDTINEMFGEDSGIEFDGTAIAIEPAQKGDFGMTLSVTIPAAKVADLDVESVKVYYVSDDGEISLMEDAVTINADGSISVAISHASGYIITDEEIEIPAGEEIYEIEDEEEEEEEEETFEEVDADTEEEAPADNNPGTGVALAGTAVLALISAAAVATTAKKRK